MATSYANSGGTGNRTALIWVQQGYQQSSGGPETATNLVDGAIGDNTTDSTDFNNGQTGVHIIFDFRPTGFKQVIDEFKWIQSNSTSHGSWEFAGSNDGVTWTLLKSSFTLVTAASTTHTVSNSTAYRMYRLIHVGGVAVSSNPWLREVEFKLEAGAALNSPLPAYVTGDRTASITVTTTATVGGGAVTHLVNGNTTENTFFWNASQSTREVKFDFGTPKIVNEMRWYQSTTASHGTWKWQGSADGSAWTDLGAFSQTLFKSAGTFSTFSNFGGNTTAYRYYRMLQTSGSTSSNPFLQEIEFRQADQELSGEWDSTEAKDIFNAASIFTGTWGSTEAKDIFNADGELPIPFALDGFASGGTASNGTSLVLSLTTTQPDDVVVVCVSTKGGPVVSISDVAGLTWTKRTGFNPASEVTQDQEIWWAHAPTPLTADNITITTTTSSGIAAVAFGVSGANYATPFDPNNANSVTTDNNGSGNPSRTITTTNSASRTFIFGYLGSDDGGGGITQGGGNVLTGMDTFVARGFTSGGQTEAALVGYKIVATPQTNLSLSFTQNGGSSNDRFLMADAIIELVPVEGEWDSTEAKDTFAGTGYPQLTGAWASTEAKDIFAGELFSPPIGAWASTEAKDVMGFVGFPTPTLGVDAHAVGNFNGTSGSATAATVAITSNFPDDVIVLAVLAGGFFDFSTIASVTDTAGLTWHKRNQRSQVGERPSQEIWWAHKPLPGPTTITVNTVDSNGFIALEAYAIKGARFTNPWDLHTGAGYYVDNYGSGNPVGRVHSLTGQGMALAFYGGRSIANNGTVTAGWTFQAGTTASETNGHTGHLSSAYKVFNAPLFEDPVSFGQLGGSSNDRTLMHDVLVSANEPEDTESTNDIIRFWLDGHGNQNILQMTGSNKSISQDNIITFDPGTVMLVAVMIQSTTGGRVDHIEDSQDTSGWERRSVIANFVGDTSLELWWVQMPGTFSGEITVVGDDNVAAGDMIGFIAFGIHGPDAFQRGSIFDGDDSLPASSRALGISYPQVGAFNSLNENVLEIAVAANNAQDLHGFQQPPWLQFIGDFFGSESGILVSSTPAFNIALSFKFSKHPVQSESAEMDVSPQSDNWLMLADVLPVGPVSPPQGVWHVTEAKDFTGNSGAFGAIGFDTLGWVGAPELRGTMPSVETKDYTSNSGAFTAIWEMDEGWIAYVPAFAEWASIEGKDISSLHAWLLGYITILARWESLEAKDRLGFSTDFEFYTTPDSVGDRTSRITVTTNAVLGGSSGTPDKLVNGGKANNAANGIWVENSQPAAMWFQFEFLLPRRLGEARWFQNGTSPQPGLWIWQGSPDGAAWTTLSDPFVLNAGNTGAVIGDLSDNDTSYLFYRILQTTNAGGNDLPWLWEIEFKADGVSGILAPVELKDRWSSQALTIPLALPIPARKRRLLIVS